jgi:hypothetical protein
MSLNKGATLIEELITEDEVNKLPIKKEIKDKLKEIDILIKKL